jgi:hypothetical protein
MTPYYYSKKKCMDAVALMSIISKDLNKVEEIMSDLSLYFKTHEIEDEWNVYIYSDLYQNIELLDKGLQKVKDTLNQL